MVRCSAIYEFGSPFLTWRPVTVSVEREVMALIAEQLGDPLDAATLSELPDDNTSMPGASSAGMSVMELDDGTSAMSVASGVCQ